MDFRHIANFINSPDSAEDLPISSPLSDDVIHIKTERQDRPVCNGCGATIYDRWMLHAGNQPFHLSCLRCTVCLLTLDNHISCYVREGRVYCRYHYRREFGTRCAACGDGLDAIDWVRHVRDHVYHVSCFTCSVCGVELSTGEEFMMKHSSLLCPAHGLLGLQNEMEDRDCESVSGGSDCSERPSKRARTNSTNKRARSNFTKEQLAVLHAHFKFNPTPSAADLDRLSGQVGHPYRVIQIWFQNARARSRRKGSSKSNTDNYVLASSPWSSDLNSPDSQHSLSE